MKMGTRWKHSRAASDIITLCWSPASPGRNDKQPACCRWQNGVKSHVSLSSSWIPALVWQSLRPVWAPQTDERYSSPWPGQTCLFHLPSRLSVQTLVTPIRWPSDLCQRFPADQTDDHHIKDSNHLLIVRHAFVSNYCSGKVRVSLP